MTKYEMSEEDYARRDNTYRKYKEAKIKEDPTWTLEKEMCIRRGKRGGVSWWWWWGGTQGIWFLQRSKRTQHGHWRRGCARARDDEVKRGVAVLERGDICALLFPQQHTCQVPPAY